jgi:hypothetical protein
MSQIPFIIPKSSRQTVRVVLHIVVFRLNIREGAIHHTASRLADRNLSTFVSIASKSTLGVEDRRVFQIVPVERPVPVN